jgi:hypothetical protein
VLIVPSGGNRKCPPWFRQCLRLYTSHTHIMQCFLVDKRAVAIIYKKIHVEGWISIISNNIWRATPAPTAVPRHPFNCGTTAHQFLSIFTTVPTFFLHLLPTTWGGGLQASSCTSNQKPKFVVLFVNTLFVTVISATTAQPAPRLVVRCLYHCGRCRHDCATLVVLVALSMRRRQARAAWCAPPRRPEAA